MKGKSRFFVVSLVIIIVVIAIIIIINATNGNKLSEAGAKLAAEKKATLNFLQSTPIPPDIKAAQEIIESDPDIAGFMKENNNDKFEVMLRNESTICLLQLKSGRKVVFEFSFDVNFEERQAKFISDNGNKFISVESKVLTLVSEKLELADLATKSKHYFLLYVVAGDNINQYTTLVEERTGTIYDKANKKISRKFYEVDLSKNTVVETDVPT